MKLGVFLVWVFCSIAALAKGDPSSDIDAQITTQIIQGERADESRYVVFNFRYKDGLCDVMTHVIELPDCAKKTAMNIRSTFSSRRYLGRDFKCQLEQITPQKWQLSISDPVEENLRLLHTVTLQDSSKQINKVLDYAGFMSGTSALTKTPIKIEYRGLRDADSFRSDVPMPVCVKK